MEIMTVLLKPISVILKDTISLEMAAVAIVTDIIGLQAG
jgi:hypothetical protein